MQQKLHYRLALDLGSASLGWALIRLNQDTTPKPVAVIKTGVRIFSDGRNPKDGSSLAVTRRQARAMRRRRDRLLKRKARMMDKLIAFGFFPKNEQERKAAEKLNPYALRAQGLDSPLKPHEFARALFHINQRRGFKSNRKTDKKENNSSVLKATIENVRNTLEQTQSRTVGERLYKRQCKGETLRARYRENRTTTEEGKNKIQKSYDLYIDRAMIEAEFDALWAKQAEYNPQLFTDEARDALKCTLLFQRPLKPVIPGRCTLMPEEQRAPLALPSQQRFRIYQEVNNLRILREGLKEEPLTLAQRDTLVATLERNNKCTFTRMKTLLDLSGTAQFNFEDPKRQELKGNSTSVILSKAEHFGDQWFALDEAQQDEIVMRLSTEEDESKLIDWLQENTGVGEAQAESIANAALAEGYGHLSTKALARILPKLREDVVTYSQAVQAAGFEHHSRLNDYGEVKGRTFDTGKERVDPKTGEVQRLHAFKELPYYGEFLTRHVGFADPKATLDDPPEKRFGRIPNPTVHIGLNQVRKVVNAIIKRYGHPSEVIVELARDLKRPKDHRPLEFRKGPITEKNMRPYCSCAGCIHVQQALLQEKNKEYRRKLECAGYQVSRYYLEKMRIREEMAAVDGIVQCPYSGEPMGLNLILSSEVEIDHILPYSKTLDDSRANKVLCLRKANQIKGEKAPFQAKDLFLQEGWAYKDIEQRVSRWNDKKRSRFAEGAMERWEEKNDYLARALNDTRYLSRVAKEYLTLICPQNTRVIPGQMTAQLRGKFGLNNILGLDGEKNRKDHRHHAIDACVIGVTDQGLLQNFAEANARAKRKNLRKLVDDMPPPWPTYRDHVWRAVQNIWVSHKPDHGYGKEMFDKTIYNATGYSRIAAKIRSVIPFAAHPKDRAQNRHGYDEQGNPKVYRGLLSNNNYCIEIIKTKMDVWIGEVISTYQAYQIASKQEIQRLRHPELSLSNYPLIMRLTINDNIRVEINEKLQTLQVLKINTSGLITFIKPNEGNIPKRYSAKLAAQKAQKEGNAFDQAALTDNFFQKSFSAANLQKARARRVTISPIGILNDPGFKD